MTELKQKINRNFSNAVQEYNEHAKLQKNIAERLANALKPWNYSIPEGPILEFGAGSGFFTRYLCEMYSNRELIISDLSDEMINHCRKNFSNGKLIRFETIDVEQTDLGDSKYALIAGNYVAQWFNNPAQTLSEIASSLKPGGFLLVSFPASESFSNWRQYCLGLGLPYTGNDLPDLEKVVINLSMGPFQVDYYEDEMTETYDTLFDYFRHLKKIGASTSKNSKTLSIKQVRLLNDYWKEQENGQINIHYHTAFIAVKRDLES